MTWIKVDDGIFNSPSFLSIGKDAKILHIAGMCYSGANLTDGHIPSGAVAILAAQTNVSASKKAVTELTTAGLWREANNGFEIVDYLEGNSSSADVREKREAARERSKRNRSQNVRPNKTRNSRDVRETDTNTEIDTETAESHRTAGAVGAERFPFRPHRS